MELVNITKKYNDKIVLNNINIEFPKGKVTAIIGPNGSGKSTLLNIMARVIKQDLGEIIFEGSNLKNLKNNDISKKISILSQTNNISMKLTVKELVSFGRFPHSGNRLDEKDLKIIDEAIEYMGLKDIENKFIDELSGGQKQRAYISMVIAQDTDYILLDEPINNLDILYSNNTMKIIRNLCDKLNKTVIVVLHEINYASFYSDYIVVLKNGNLEKFGKVNEIIDKEFLEKIYNVKFDVQMVNNKPLSIYYENMEEK